MDNNSLLNVFQSGLTYVQPALATVVGALLTTLFLRGNTAKQEFEKLKASRFDEVADILLKDGKMSYCEYYKCKNFLSIAKLADKEKIWDKQTTDYKEKQGFDFDWFMRLFDSVGNVSDIDMQLLWARVLAGEICNHGSFSLRTIETLKNMNREDAIVFQKMAHLVLTDKSGLKFIMCMSNDLAQDINEKYGIGKSEFIMLEECGLLSSVRDDNRVILNESLPGIWNGNIIIIFRYKLTEGVLNSYKYSCYTLTRTAEQLLSIVDEEPYDSYILDIAKELSKKYSGNLFVTAHRIIHNDISSFEYDSDVIEL